MKPLHLPIIGHDLLSVERYRDDTRHMIEFLVLSDCPLGRKGQYIRRFLSDQGYSAALRAQKEQKIKLYKHAAIVEGHILPDKRKKRRGK